MDPFWFYFILFFCHVRVRPRQFDKCGGARDVYGINLTAMPWPLEIISKVGKFKIKIIWGGRTYLKSWWLVTSKKCTAVMILNFNSCHPSLMLAAASCQVLVMRWRFVINGVKAFSLDIHMLWLSFS